MTYRNLCTYSNNVSVYKLKNQVCVATDNDIKYNFDSQFIQAF